MAHHSVSCTHQCKWFCELADDGALGLDDMEGLGGLLDMQFAEGCTAVQAPSHMMAVPGAAQLSR